MLGGKRSGPEILNYFRAAQGIYDLALQRYREHELVTDMALLRHIHSELFRELDPQRGLFRAGKIQISGAKVQPPSIDIEEYIRAFLRLVPVLFAEFSDLEALARLHVLFESIHPFRDGNGRTGRTGRILLNYLAISRGWPPIIIKGEQEADRQRYYAALEAGDAGFHHGFPPPPELYERLEQGNFTAMQNLLADGVVPQLDLLLVKLAQEQEPLRPLADLAAHFGVQEATLRQWVSRGQLIAVKQGRKLYSAPSLFLRLTG